jgi:Flp pilus assembly protein TadG
MRVTRALRRARDEESGATMVIVALSLVVLLGMVALVVDGGGMYVAKRRVVAAADAAALAAAQSCASGLAAQAPSQADRYARSNAPGAARTGYSTQGCGAIGSGSVTVRYSAEQQLFFAPVLGLPSKAQVGATATAMWQPAGGALAIPVEVSLSGDTFPCASLPIGSPCNYWHDQANNNFPNSSDWGFMNLGEQWNVPADAHCHDPGASTLWDWIHTGLDVKLDPNGPTYVCVSHGFEHSTWFGALRDDIGGLVVFPVNDPATMIRTPGEQKYSIVGFAELRLEDVLAGNDARALEKCPGHAPDANGVCVVATWQGFRVGGLEGPGARDVGLRTIRLSG